MIDAMRSEVEFLAEEAREQERSSIWIDADRGVPRGTPHGTATPVCSSVVSRSTAS
jgi:hypothetical protein